jgi:hypothetical protein
MPTSSLEAAMEWLESVGERVTVAPRGATSSEIAELERRLGRKLPPGHVGFLREYHWLSSRLFTTLAVFDTGGAPTIEARTQAVHQFVQPTLEQPSLMSHAGARQNGEILRECVAIAEAGGNALPLGEGFFLDGAGRLRWSDVKELAFWPVQDVERCPAGRIQQVSPGCLQR